MGNYPYDYEVLVEYINPYGDGEYPQYSHLGFHERLSKTLREVFNHLCESISDDCEIVSHNITCSRDEYILTVLLKKRKKEVLTST